MKTRVILAVIFAILLSGCVTEPDKEGWSYSQKNEFLHILKTDKYASICNKQALYENIKDSSDSRLMTRMLVGYANNLANSCIDIYSFKAIQADKKANKITTHFDLNQETINTFTITNKLKAGFSVEKILEPYIPQTKQFALLLGKYKALKQYGGNVTQEQLKKIRLNIERTKLMKENLGNDYALINIPEYKVRFIDGNATTALSFGVIVGKPHLQTPVFSAPMKYITLNPQWSVPDSIAVGEIIPKLIRNKNYLKSHRMVIRKSYALKSEPVDVNSVDWRAYLKENSKNGHLVSRKPLLYKFIEIPSKRNVLGRIKFIFPNSHSVYMHDTQTKKLFKRKARPFSHGCIRVEKPMTMLNYVSTKYTSKMYAEAKDLYETLNTHHIGLNRELMVHTTYFTAYVGEDGVLKLHSDIYGFDKSQQLNF